LCLSKKVTPDQRIRKHVFARWPDARFENLQQERGGRVAFQLIDRVSEQMADAGRSLVLEVVPLLARQRQQLSARGRDSPGLLEPVIALSLCQKLHCVRLTANRKKKAAREPFDSSGRFAGLK
jgi:hypothetical protein